MLLGATALKDRFAVDGIGLGVIVGKQLALYGRLGRVVGCGWQLNARLVEVLLGRDHFRPVA